MSMPPCVCQFLHPICLLLVPILLFPLDVPSLILPIFPLRLLICFNSAQLLCHVRSFTLFLFCHKHICSIFLFHFLFLWLAALLPLPLPVSHSPHILLLLLAPPLSSLPSLPLGSPSCLYKLLSAGLHHFCGSFPNSRHTAGLACQHIHYTCALCECVFGEWAWIVHSGGCVVRGTCQVKVVMASHSGTVGANEFHQQTKLNINI